jgi:hypothetical protein
MEEGAISVGFQVQVRYCASETLEIVGGSIGDGTEIQMTTTEMRFVVEKKPLSYDRR